MKNIEQNNLSTIPVQYFNPNSLRRNREVNIISWGGGEGGAGLEDFDCFTINVTLYPHKAL